MRKNPTSRQIAIRAWTDARASAIVAVCALLVGVAVRLALYFQNVSLWFDEIGVALSVATRSRFDMETAPPLYLWIESMSALAGGINEAALRLPALLAGLIALVCIAWLGFRAGGSWAGAIAAALAAFSANLCRYSNELKPYGIDAAVSAVLLLSAMSVLNGGSRLGRLVLFATGLLCIPLSTPSVFVLAGIVVALIINERRPGLRQQWRWSRFLWIGAAALAWAFLFLIVYRAFYAPIAASEYMRRFWAGALVTPSSGPHRIITAITDALVIPVLGLQIGTFPIRIMGLTFLFAGVRAAFRRSGAAFATLLCAPVAAGITAALMGDWYLRTRLMLFSAPEICLLMALGIWQLSRWVPEPLQLRALWIVSIVALILPVKHTLSTISHPERQGFRGLVAAAIGHAQPGDVIYIIYPRTAQAWTFYSVDWRHNGLNVAEPMMATILRSGPNSGNMPSRHAFVIHEGFDWRFERAGRIELLGVATGIMSNTFGTESAPDPGWADNEIDRMLNEHSAKRLWILASDASGLDSLLQRLSERGFSVDLAYEGPGPVLLYRALHSAAPK